MSTLVAIGVLVVLFVVFVALRLGDRGGCQALAHALDEAAESCAPGTGGTERAQDSEVREEGHEDGVEQKERR